MSDLNSAAPIFVVGVSRSGTTLMRRILDSSGEISIATENHYLGHLLDREGARYYFRRCGPLEEDATIRRIVELIYSGEFQRRSRFREISPYWRWLIRTIDRDAFEQRLLATDRTERGFFEALMRTYADHRGTPRFGEKTPAHIKHVDTLVEWFPEARIVHMLRDPRAIFVSELRRRRERAVTVPYRQLKHVPILFSLFVMLQTTVAWADAIRRHEQLRSRYPDAYRVVRFEELVAQPRETLTELFAFLDVPMSEQVLDQKVTSKGFHKGQSGFDPDAADRWRELIHPWVASWFRRVLGGRMKRVGYRP